MQDVTSGLFFFCLFLFFFETGKEKLRQQAGSGEIPRGRALPLPYRSLYIQGRGPGRRHLGCTICWEGTKLQIGQ